ncbi:MULTISPECIES: hypothetical protein [unclassified Lysobacter]|uniref:hypothetical protein n=1 Tax=unclassified Lysobacter TaxID=2635362 RepID=UPI000708CB05|nr:MULTISPECIES: hypothetical protein [unclassified Lysobacter]KRD40120.1 hypothetical protein ASE35_07435 [Lysobacter sp. Root916]KRD80150.1 hypothetical protein ASE43_04545 [Lysobacter sp. Root983]
MTKMFRRCTTAALAFAGLFAASAHADTVFAVHSQAGDPVGAGQSAVYTDADSTMTMEADAHSIRLTVARGDDHWYVSVGAPTQRKFELGRYYDAEHPTLRTGRAPYVYMANGGRRCDDLWGEIHIQQLELDRQGRVAALEATVLQRCGSASAPVLAAVIRHNVAPYSVKLDSGGDDPVGQGLQKSYFGDTSTFHLLGESNYMDFTVSGQRDVWRAKLRPPVGGVLQPGTWPIGTDTSALFVFDRPSQGRCSWISGGQVEVKGVRYDPLNGRLIGIHVDFEQFCDGADKPLRGSIRYGL